MTGQPCTRHHGHCAYTADDPARCPTCHRAWQRITGRDGQTYREHLAEHIRPESERAKSKHKHQHAAARAASA